MRRLTATALGALALVGILAAPAQALYVDAYQSAAGGEGFGGEYGQYDAGVEIATGD
ncbi:hypothetical protein [Allostreptomyces psammosilenae]|uniref:Uncharacterized protein n=1 Tax=Allostreptomyces psammosilenae TaxID=1892865 RepID=A0A853A0B0_9ACTN|nr:hypothetical protein [Allostreptomyces psammosilenae]NYI04251.1 hypothetical protein [Allostreptomyces psammosilenae]